MPTPQEIYNQQYSGTQYDTTLTPQQSYNNMYGGVSNVGGLPVTTSRTSGTWMPAYSGFGGTAPAYQTSPDVTRQTYSGQGGTFTRTQAGNNTPSGWKDASGRVVSDLQGYLGMRGQQQVGSDFSGYQNQLSSLMANPSSIQNNPAYQARIAAGEQAINRSAAARGMLGSGNVLAELAKYSGQQASQEYENQLNQLADLMRGAQSFGLQSGFYSSDPRTSPFGLAYTNANVSPW